MIEKVHKDFEIVEIAENNGLKINNKKASETITIYDSELINAAIAKNFNKMYREILYLIMDINESDDSTESDALLALLKIDNVRKILLNTYQKFLPPNLLRRYLNMLDMLGNKIFIPNHSKSR